MTRFLPLENRHVLHLLVVATICLSSTCMDAQYKGYSFIAHSHNDYEQEQPIFKAMSLGFTSLEVDVMLHDGRLVVSHDAKHLEDKPSFDIDYLWPILNEISENNYPKIHLLIDIKDNDINQVLGALRAIFDDRKSILCNNGQLFAPLKVILSGLDTKNRDMVHDLPDYLHIDGRLSDLDLLYTCPSITWISAKFSDVTSWRGLTRPTQADLSKLIALVDSTHARGKKLRFWDTPETPIVWHTLIAIGVDIISLDDLEAFHKATSFLK